MTARTIPVVLGGGPREFFSENCQGNGRGDSCQIYDYATSLCCPACTHPGADIQAYYEPVYSATDGAVIVAQADCNFYTPNWIQIEPTTGQFAGDQLIYAHLSNIASGIYPGATVTKGQRIGTTGTDGCPPNYGNEHLHFEHRVPDPCGYYGWRSADPVPILTSTDANGGGATPTLDLGNVLRVTEALNLREGPGLGEPRITTMVANTRVMVVSPSGPTVADGFHWYKIQTRHGRGWAAGEYLIPTAINNLTANPTANTNLDFIEPNRTVTTISQVSLDGSYRVRAVTAGTATVEGTRYLSDSPLNMHNERYFAGVINQVKGTPGKILDFQRHRPFCAVARRPQRVGVVVALEPGASSRGSLP